MPTATPVTPFWIYRNDFLRAQDRRVPSFTTETEADILQSLAYDDSIFKPYDPEDTSTVFRPERTSDYTDLLEITDGVCVAGVDITKGSVLDIIDGDERRIDTDSDFFQKQTQLCINNPYDTKHRMFGVLTVEATQEIYFHWWTRLLPPTLARPFDFHAIMAWPEGHQTPCLIFIRNVLQDTKIRVLRLPNLAINQKFMPAQKQDYDYLWAALLALPIEDKNVLEKTLKLFFYRSVSTNVKPMKDVNENLKAAFGDSWPSKRDDSSLGAVASGPKSPDIHVGSSPSSSASGPESPDGSNSFADVLGTVFPDGDLDFLEEGPPVGPSPPVGE
jgi:hypothetical protein